jgi:hypothetical protein
VICGNCFGIGIGWYRCARGSWNQPQAVAMNEGKHWKKKLWSEQGRVQLEKLPFAPWASRRRKELLELLNRLNPIIEELTAAVEQEAKKQPEVLQLMTHPGMGPPLAGLAATMRSILRFSLQ